MKILSGQQLVNSIRKDADKIKSRLWIAVPYIGNISTVRRILGNIWINKSNISVKLITDISEISNFNFESLKTFLQMGSIRDIRGLHAKVYILDNICFITSANLTSTAFKKRTEIGIKLNKIESRDAIKIFNNWWLESKNISKVKIAKRIKSSRKKSKEEKAGEKLADKHKLPDDPGGNLVRIPIKYLNHASIVEMYHDFALLYSKYQRIWKNAPLYLEVDAFLNYLYHDHADVPSNSYKDKPPRTLEYYIRLRELKKYARQFMSEADISDIKWRLETTRIARKIFSKNHLTKINRNDVRKVFKRINSLKTWGFHLENAINENTLKELRKNLNVLLHEKEKRLPERFTICSSLKNFKESSMFELIGIYYPEKYPLINNNALSGLRFFGYDVKMK